MRILVVRTDKLGDFITALPSMYVLKKHNPENKIIVCIAPINKALAEACDFIDEVIIDDGKTSIFGLAKKIKKAKIDASITLFSNTRIAITQFLAGIKVRIAPATKIAQIFYNKRITQRRSEVKMAEFEYNLQLTKALFPDIDLTYKKPLLNFDEVKKNIIAFHVGFGGSSDANWTLDEYEVLIRTTLKQNKYQALMTFGPDEIDLYEDMKERFKDDNVEFYLSKDGLIAFAKLVSTFKLFISTSTGTYHVASLVGTPTMTFFGSSLFASAARWKSVGCENLQRHYMLPSDNIQRNKIFKQVINDIASI